MSYLNTLKFQLKFIMSRSGDQPYFTRYEKAVDYLDYYLNFLAEWQAQMIFEHSKNYNFERATLWLDWFLDPDYFTVTFFIHIRFGNDISEIMTITIGDNYSAELIFYNENSNISRSISLSRKRDINEFTEEKNEDESTEKKMKT